MNRRELEEVQGKKKKNRSNLPVMLRGVALGLAFVLVAGYLVVQLKRIQVDEKDEWRSRAVNQQTSTTEITAARGTIYDANGNAMAQSVTVWTLEAAPNVLLQSKIDTTKTGTSDIARFAAGKLADILELDEDELYENFNDEEKKYYKVKPKIDKPEADEVRELISDYSLRGFTLTEDSKRYYPYQDLAASVLGFVNDEGGAEGLEYYYEEYLSGEPGREVSVVNALGGEMAADDSDSVVYDPQDGYDLVLTMDAEIQQVLEKYLSKAVEEHNASERGMGIVMNTKTGAIYGMATYPAFDPNEPYEIYDEATRLAIEELPESERGTAVGEARIRQWRNKAVADTYEPGSVFKIITAAAAIDSGIYNINSYFACASYIEMGDDIKMSCAGSPPTAHGSIPLSEALIQSCNVSFIQMGWGMGRSTWYDYVNAFGLTEPTGIDLPAEPGLSAISSLVYSEEDMGEVELASVSYGQSNKYTALQMATAVSAAVNGGHLMQPYMVSAIQDQNGNVVESFEPVEKRQVISSETSEQLATTLEQLVSQTSNGRNAYVAGYNVGGKSGTSQKLERMTQDNVEVYISSFLGFAPAEDPEITVLFVLDEPDDSSGYGTWFGGRLAGPSVGSIVSEVMPILGNDPDYGDGDGGRTYTTAPAVTGMTQENALVELNQQGISYQVVGEGNTVTAQYPEAGNDVPSGGLLILYTDDAATQTVQVPSLEGLAVGVAKSTLKDLGLNVMLTGAPESSDSNTKIEVTVQDIAAGTEVPKGTTVTITLQDNSVVVD